MICSAYNIYMQIFPPRSSMYKLTILLTSTKYKQLKNLAIYLQKVFKLRTEAINIVNTV